MSQVKWNGDEVFLKVFDQTIRNLNTLGNAMKKDMKESMKPGTGRIYPSRTGKGTHQASKPFYPPAPDTKDLKNAIKSEVTVEGTDIYLKVGVLGNEEEVAYPYYLEIGTFKMAPRPYIRPCLERFRPRIVAIIGRPHRISVTPSTPDIE